MWSGMRFFPIIQHWLRYSALDCSCFLLSFSLFLGQTFPVPWYDWKIKFDCRKHLYQYSVHFLMHYKWMEQKHVTCLDWFFRKKIADNKCGKIKNKKFWVNGWNIQSESFGNWDLLWKIKPDFHPSNVYVSEDFQAFKKQMENVLDWSVLNSGIRMHGNCSPKSHESCCFSMTTAFFSISTIYIYFMYFLHTNMAMVW